MGTSTSAVELGRKFDQLAREVEKRQKLASKAGADTIERAVKPRIRSATGGDYLLSGMGKRGRIGVRQKPRGDSVLVAATGPAHLIESDVAKHYVVSRFAKGAQRIGANGRKLRSTRQSRIASVAFGQGAAGGGRRAVLNLGNGQFRRWTVAHSKGRHPWRDGVRASRNKAQAAMVKAEAAAVAKVFT